MAHITGGGLPENLPRTLNGLGATLDRDAWPRPQEMSLIQEWGGIEDREMARAFNLGVGFTVTVSPDAVDATQESLSRSGIESWVIGQVRDLAGVEFS